MSCDLHQGDCLELMALIPDGSVDAIICDLPYGTTACKWDTVIPFEPLWAHYKRVIKPNGAIVLFGSQPFTSALVMSNVKMFKYEWVWNKKIPSGMAYCRYQPMRQHENVLVFCKGRTIYNPQLTQRDKPIKAGGNSQSELNNKGVEKPLKKIYTTKQPTTLIEFIKIRQESIHPTQKPVALLEYLIRTYTNKGETVLDNCMGSGTTGVACVNTGRSFIGIEKDAAYFEIASNRIKGHNPLKT